MGGAYGFVKRSEQVLGSQHERDLLPEQLQAMLDSGGRHPSTVQILRFFTYGHLPDQLQPISRACALLALDMVERLPDSPELTVGLRKLLEAKDAFVRSTL